MSGFNKSEFNEMKRKHEEIAFKNDCIVPHFNYKKMKNPYKDKDMKYNFNTL